MRPERFQPTQKHRAVVTPNVDTIYTQAFLDVSAEPMLYGVPQTDRFFNVQVLDAWTNTVAVLEAPGLYAITRSDWQGNLPEGVQRINVPTNMVWTIARIVLSGQEDLPNVRAIQDRMQLMPLSAYQMDSWTAPAGKYDPAYNFVPVQHVLAMCAEDFFTTAKQIHLQKRMRRCFRSSLRSMSAPTRPLRKRLLVSPEHCGGSLCCFS